MTIRDKVLKNGFNFFKGFFPQILHGPICNTLSHIRRRHSLLFLIYDKITNITNYRY